MLDLNFPDEKSYGTANFAPFAQLLFETQVGQSSLSATRD